MTWKRIVPLVAIAAALCRTPRGGLTAAGSDWTQWPNRGDSCSPLAYNGSVIVTVGGRDQSVAAFNQQTDALSSG